MGLRGCIHSLVCAKSTIRAWQITAAIAFIWTACAPAFAACGDNGGPGYRNQSGKCVGWEALARQCGNPPSAHCTPENVASESSDAAAKGSTIRSLMDRAHADKARSDR